MPTDTANNITGHADDPLHLAPTEAEGVCLKCGWSCWVTAASCELAGLEASRRVVLHRRAAHRHDPAQRAA